MSRRPYIMRKRAQSAAKTRQRLVEATFQLHTERGIAATTMQQIAERADVSIGTAYHHFSTYDEAIRACGAYTQEHYQPPGPEAFGAEVQPQARLGALARAYFAFFERLPVLEHVRRDQTVLPVLRDFVAGEEAHRRHMVGLALGADSNDKSVLDLIAALIDLPMLTALKRMGHDAPSAARLITDLAMSWIANRRTRSEKRAAAQPQEDSNDHQDR